jgi:hypothetical protein
LEGTATIAKKTGFQSLFEALPLFFPSLLRKNGKKFRKGMAVAGVAELLDPSLEWTKEFH